MEPSDSQGSFARLIKALENQDEEAATFIYTKYIGSLIRLASKKLDLRLGAKVDPETVAHSVIKLFFDKFQKNEIEFENWEALYAYLAKVTIKKSLNRNRLHWQLKRGGGSVNNQGKRSTQVELEEIYADITEPDPAEVAEINDMIEMAMCKIKPQHRSIMEVFLGNHSKEKTAELTGFSLRTVQRVINEFREEISRLGNVD